MSDPENDQEDRWWTPGPIDNFFIVGTGACEGSWDPVREAILDVDGRAELHVDVAPGHPAYDAEYRAAADAANFWFAELVHRRRRCAAFAAAHPRLDEQCAVKEAQFAKIDRDVKAALVYRLRTAVSKERIRIRPEFWTAMGDQRFEGSAWYATTNWDLTLEKTAEEKLDIDLRKVHHFHGSTARPERMLLPSEVLEESYRSEQEREAVAESVIIWKPLSWARQICIYGLGLSVSDAELAQTLEMGFEDHQVEPGAVVIYNVAAALPALERKIRRLSKGLWKIDCIAVETLSRR